MMDKTKRSPIPDKTASPAKEVAKEPTQRSSDPQFVRGTIDPPTKKGS